MAEKWERRAFFVALKSSNSILKWIQAVAESLRSRLSKGGVQHGGM